MSMPFFTFGGPPSDEQIAEMKKARDMQLMQRQEWQTRLMRFFDEMSGEDMRTMTQFLYMLENGADSANLISYWQGICQSYLRLKHDNICMDCGVVHTDDFLGHDAANAMHEMGGNIPSDPAPEEPIAPDEEPVEDAVAMAERLTAERDAEMLKFRVEFRPDAPAGAVFCTGCGLQYISLADRMMKAPDDCHGCHSKGAWG